MWFCVGPPDGSVWFCVGPPDGSVWFCVGPPDGSVWFYVGPPDARRGHSGTEGGRTCVTYFAEEGVFF